MVSDEVLLECDASSHRFLTTLWTQKRREDAFALRKLARNKITPLGHQSFLGSNVTLFLNHANLDDRPLDARHRQASFRCLKANDIKLLADVRSLPGSKRYPQFNKETLADSLGKAGIRYEHFPELGGRRKAKPDSKNTAWRNESFRGYADYMEIEEFDKGVERLLDLAAECRTDCDHVRRSGLVAVSSLADF